jgi:hypothetical protein
MRTATSGGWRVEVAARAVKDRDERRRVRQQLGTITKKECDRETGEMRFRQKRVVEAYTEKWDRKAVVSIRF